MIALLALLVSQAPALPPGHPDIAPTAHANPSGPTAQDFDNTLAQPGSYPDVNAMPDGGDAMSAKDLLVKLDQMKAALKARPKTAEIEFALGNLYYENGRWPDAIDSYRQLLARAEGPLSRYQALRNHPHQPIAAKDARCGDGSDRMTFDALVEAADAKTQGGNVSAALMCYEAALLPMTLAFTRRGNAWYLIGNEERAIADHERVLAILPEDPDSLFFLGAILFEGGEGDVPRLKQAKGYWQRFLKVNDDPDRQQLVTKDLLRLQVAIDSRGKVPREMPPQMRAMSVGPITPPPPPRALRNDQRQALARAVARGTAALADKDWPAARAAFASGRQLDPGDVEAARGEGVALLKQGHLLEAEAALRDALGRNPDDALSLYQLGEVYFREEHYTGATRFWSQVMESDPKLSSELKLGEKIQAAQQAQ